MAVAVTSSLGNGFPDLVCALVGARKVFLVEVKDGKRPPSQRKLTDDEQRFFDEWNGCVHIVSSLDQVDELVKELRRC